MAVSSIYMKGLHVDSDKEWYHGEITREQAEKTLRSYGSNCFLIRESKGNQVLSLVDHGVVDHILIQRQCGRYSLSGWSHLFNELHEFVEYISNHKIKAMNSTSRGIAVGEVCKKSRRCSLLEDPKRGTCTDHTYNTGAYLLGEPAGLAKYYWYHSNMSKEEAERALGDGDGRKLLVRQSSNNLVLSYTDKRWIHHHPIIYSVKGYRLEGEKRSFKTVPEMIAYYLLSPIASDSDRVISHYRKENSTYEQIYQEPIFKSGEHKFKVSWKKCTDMPVPLSSPQVVRIGDSVYVGGGFRKHRGRHGIQKYNVIKDEWTLLPDCPTAQHSLTSLKEELVTIGGILRSSGEISNIVYTFRDGGWNQVLPWMHTPRCLLSATSHEDGLIVAAGGVTRVEPSGRLSRTDVVEIYKGSGQWHTTKRLPFPVGSFNATIISDTCYLLGGSARDYDFARTTLHTTLTSLLEYAESADPIYSTAACPVKWSSLSGRHPLPHCTSMEVFGLLTSIGGTDCKNLSGTKLISAYDFISDSWVKCKGVQLPLSLFRPGVAQLLHDRVMIFGGELKNRHFSEQVFIGEFKK